MGTQWFQGVVPRGVPDRRVIHRTKPVKTLFDQFKLYAFMYFVRIVLLIRHWENCHYHDRFNAVIGQSFVFDVHAFGCSLSDALLCLLREGGAGDKNNKHRKKKKSKFTSETDKSKSSKKSSKKKRKKKKRDGKRKRADASGNESGDEGSADATKKQKRKSSKSKPRRKRRERSRGREEESSSEDSDEEEGGGRTQIHGKRQRNADRGSQPGLEMHKKRRKNWKARSQEHTSELQSR